MAESKETPETTDAPEAAKKVRLPLSKNKRVTIAVIVVAYIVAPGADPVAYSGLPQSKSVLKLTDTILILTYVFCGATILSVIVGAIVSGSRNKK